MSATNNNNATRKVTINILDDERVTLDQFNESWSIEELVRYYPIPTAWQPVFEEANDELITISDTITKKEKEGKYKAIPLRREIFSLFHLCSDPKSIRCVIIGQDPYHQILVNGLPRPVGLSFSVRREDTIPSSLANIYRELARGYPGFVTPCHGDLTSWVKQGVFLLNTSLTVKPGQPNSHAAYWTSFVYKVIDFIIKANPQVIFVLWGREAQKLESKLDKIKVLTAPHPSGRSADMGFIGCNHFKLINEHLTSINSDIIDWNVY